MSVDVNAQLCVCAQLCLWLLSPLLGSVSPQLSSTGTQLDVVPWLSAHQLARNELTLKFKSDRFITKSR